MATTNIPSVFQIKALRRNFRNYCGVDIFRTFGFTEPMVSDTKDWEGSLKPYYQRAADHLASKGVTFDMARAANGFWKKQRNRGTAATGLAKLGFQGAAVSWGKGAAAPAPAAAAAAPASVSPDAKAVLATAFAEGKITIDQFTAAIAALGATTPVKSVDIPPVETIELDATGSEDLAF